MDHKLVESTVGSGRISIGDVMKPETDRNCSTLGSENADASTGLANERKMAGIFNRHRLIKNQ